MSNIYYEIYSKTMTPCSIDKEVYEHAMKTWLCRECASPRLETKEIDVKIQEEQPDKSPLNFLSGCGLGIAKKEFLFSFGRELVLRHLYLGNLFNKNSELLEEWVTFFGKRHWIIRGTRNVSYRKCPSCGKHLYFATGQRYLYPKPPDRFEILDLGNGGLLVSENLISNIIKNKWPKLVIQRILVTNKPKDNLGLLEL